MTTASTAGSGSDRSRRRKYLTVGLFLLPALLVYGVFVLLPIAQAAWYSLFDWNGLEPLTDFIGLENYVRALNDRFFLDAVWHNVLIVILSLTLQIPFALWLALQLNRNFRGRTLLRVLFFVPFVLSEAVTGIVFQLLLYPNGLVDRALETAGLGFLVQLWLADRSIVMMTMFVIISWKYFGFHMILMLAGLQGIPRELEEAAAIDGATRGQTVRRIIIPLLGPTIRVSVFLSIIGAIQLFDLVWATTKGGPFHASDTMAVYLVHFGIERAQMGYGSAIAVILFAICLVVAVAYVRFIMRRDTEGGVTTGAG
ncbi:MAG: sugar ABC transporter permease [Candidatus Limnocylindrales bacterium]